MLNMRNFLLHRASQSAMNTMHYLTRIRFALVLRIIRFTLDDKVHFCGICIVMPGVLAPASAFYSPQSVTSEVDVNSYAEAMVQHLESKQGTDQENQVVDRKEGELTTPDVLEGKTDQSIPLPRGAGTPIPVGETEESHLSLTALESALVIATSSGSQYHELLTAAEEVRGDQSRTVPQSEDDTTSCMYLLYPSSCMKCLPYLVMNPKSVS